jgi:glycosyltransferase involved in cell wall biosynthesis
MPVFNASKFLEEAVESLQRQTFRDWQLLIIDDGSDDDSLAIIRKLAALDSRILYQTQSNIGLVGTLNKLVKWSTAPLLARMDADDISKPDRFFKQLRFMDERPDIDIVGCWVELFGAKSEIWHFRESDNNTRILSLFGQCCVTHASLIVKRQVFETVPYDANYEHTEDLEFLSRIITKTDFRFGNVRECLYRYRMHHKSIVYVQAQKRKVAYEKLLELHFERLGITLSRTQYLDYWSFLKAEQVDRNTGRRIGLLLDKIRQSISSFLPDEHHEIAFRWWKYCRLNNFLDLYPLCKAQAFMFLEQKNI